MKNQHSLHVFRKMLVHDLSSGIVLNAKHFIPFLLCAIVACLLFGTDVANSSMLTSPARLTFFDYLIQFFRGMKEFTALSPTDRFDLPVWYLLPSICLAYVVGLYPLRDLKRFGLQVITRAQNRTYWWLSKCVWCVCTVLVAYLLYYACFLVMALMNGGDVFSFTPEVNGVLSLVDTARATTAEMWIWGVAIPVFTSVAFSLFQLTVSLYTRPVFGMLAVVSLLALSAFYAHPFWAGNYLMLIRTPLNVENPLQSTLLSAVAVNGALILLSVTAGLIRFKRYDIL